MMEINLNKVLKFAKEKHENQIRANGLPYITHPIRVSEIVKEVKPNSKYLTELVAASLLHDTLEDTFTSFREIEREFGTYVGSLVLELSSAPFAADSLGKTQYLCGHMVYMTSHALVIKLADRLDNVSDMHDYSKEKKRLKYQETKEIIEFLEKNRKLTETHKKLIERINKVINQPL